jgi:hypothetical protein
MKSLFAIASILFAHSTQAQFAITKDADGFVYVRSSAEVKQNIVDTLPNYFVVWCFELSGNWYSIDYEKHGEFKTGYVYQNRVKLLSKFDTIHFFKKEPHKLVLQKDSLRVLVQTEKFKRKENKLQYFKEDGNAYIEFINGKKYWGKDGGLPTSQYKTIVVQNGATKYSLPKKAVENLFEPNLDFMACYADRKNDLLYITSSNGDAAGSYEVVWILKKGKYQKRFVTISF